MSDRTPIALGDVQPGVVFTMHTADWAPRLIVRGGTIYRADTEFPLRTVEDVGPGTIVWAVTPDGK